MKDFEFTSFKEELVVAVIAVLATLCFLGSVLFIFNEDGRTPWFRADTDLAALLQRCQGAHSSSARHQCLREVAALAQGQQAVALAPR